MKNCTHLATWVTRDAKARFALVAQTQGLTESALLKRLVELTLQTASVGVEGKRERYVQVPRESRLTIRLRPDDRLLLRERAVARGMAPATYVSVLTRAHLRTGAPLPKEELASLKRSVAELGAIGRNVNQIARVANETGRITGPTRED